MSGRLPDFLIVGGSRCGTSWLAKNLSTHPEVFVPGYKEVHYFDRHYSKGIDWYKSCFSNRSESLVGEATPGYLYSEEAPGLIRQHIPDVKIVVILRNPVERAYSHYWNLVAKARRKKKIYDVSFEDKVNARARLVDEGIYSRKLERYYELFPKKNIKVMLYDHLVRDPCGFLQEICRFLGIDYGFESGLARNRINASDSKLESSTILFWLHVVFMKMGLNKFGKWIDERNKPLLPPMKEETRSLLLNRYYLKEIEVLEELLGCDLNSWKD